MNAEKKLLERHERILKMISAQEKLHLEECRAGALDLGAQLFVSTGYRLRKGVLRRPGLRKLAHSIILEEGLATPIFVGGRVVEFIDHADGPLALCGREYDTLTTRVTLMTEPFNLNDLAVFYQQHHLLPPDLENRLYGFSSDQE